VGVLPIDRHAFKLAEVERRRGFVEESTSWSERRWEHRRHLEPDGEHGFALTDRLTFTPRLPGSGSPLSRLVDTTLTHRHRVLRERFGGRAA
jgi:hypothetical protein